MSTSASWRLLQLADSGFPTGGFAHSAGLEAALHLGAARTPADLEAYVHAFLWNVGHASLPFVAAAHDDPRSVWDLDTHVDARITNHVANRASRTQGRTFLAACTRIFDLPSLAELAGQAAARDASVHLAPVFGATLAALAVDRSGALALHLLLALRGLISAAVRLGIVGPHEGQRLQSRLTPTLDAVLAECAGLRPDDAATVAPLLDVFGMAHDRLYARLFQS